jgi:hypothetical protein
MLCVQCAGSSCGHFFLRACVHTHLHAISTLPRKNHLRKNCLRMPHCTLRGKAEERGTSAGNRAHLIVNKPGMMIIDRIVERADGQITPQIINHTQRA